jgi:membrane protein required for beta-lactamase induction
MMVFTTLFIAIIIIALLYYFLIRNIPWVIPSYLLVIFVGILCFIPGDVHFRYVGIEIIGFGSLVVWHHYNKIKENK